MATQSAGVRMSQQARLQLKRLSRALGRAQGVLLAEYIARAYKATLEHQKYGPLLRLVEETEGEEPAATTTRQRGAVIRLNGEEAVQLRRRAMETTGDPGDASELAREVIREHLLAPDRDPHGRG